MRDGFAEDFTPPCLEKFFYEKTSLSPSNTRKYDGYFKRYVHTFVKETVRLYRSMKEFGLAKGA
jgi:hypothetical protein